MAQLLSGTDLTANEQLFDALLRHQVGLIRVAGGVRNEIWALLDATERDLRTRITEAGRSGLGFSRPAHVVRLQRLLSDIESSRGAAWDRAAALLRDRAIEVALAEPAFMDGIVRTVMPVSMGTRLPPAAQLRSIVASRPFEGRVLREWSKDIKRADLERIGSAINVGIVQGDSIPEIARRVVGRVSMRGQDGVTAVARRQAAGLARTAVTAIANYGRLDWSMLNKAIIAQEIFVATLDDRTTQLCAGWDGSRHEVGKGPVPPLHFACRSIRIPSLEKDAALTGERPEKPITRKQLLREFADSRGIARVKSRDSLPRGTKGDFDQFSRRRVRELVGPVPANLSYEKWLGRQSREFQDDYLGPTKGKLFRNGMSIRSFSESNRVLSLEQLARRDAAAFRAAGLDPEEFFRR